MFEAWASLLGAVVGGGLVLLGDGVRRRWEARQAGRQRLFEAAVALAVVYNQAVGAVLDAKRLNLDRAEVPLPGVERYEVETRFWATPGSAVLSREAAALSRTWTALLAAYDDDGSWEHAREQHREALWAFERAVRTVMGDRTPPVSP